MSQVLKSRVVVASRLAAGPDRVWAEASTLEGVNLEMSPWLRLTSPTGAGLAAAADGELLALKLTGPFRLPLGTYRLGLIGFSEGEGFLEQTRMLPFLLWQHERRISPEPGGGTQVTDSLGWQWRLSLADRLAAVVVRWFFSHRHRRLKSRFGQVRPAGRR